MLQRTSILEHPGGDTIQTPILVPSFSSRGFHGTRTGRKDLLALYHAAVEMLSDSMLISAYDIHYRLLPQPSRAIVRLTILDSGGYEVLGDVDAVIEGSNYKPRPWSKPLFEAVRSKWPSRVPAIIVTYDTPGRCYTLAEQIRRARTAASSSPEHLTDFLMKPEAKSPGLIDVEAVARVASDLGGFPIIGVTEKELGRTPLDRMTCLARLRQTLDQAKIRAPIHVFGGLDPVSTPLYFIAGAEIFDGLAWLRYGFSNGSAVYRQNFASLNIGVSESDSQAQARMMLLNLGYLVRMREQLRRFAISGEFSQLGQNAIFFEEAQRLLRSRMEGA